jgi:hypothetical protein
LQSSDHGSQTRPRRLARCQSLLRRHTRDRSSDHVLGVSKVGNRSRRACMWGRNDVS